MSKPQGKKPEITCAIFDLDGTLFDSRHRLHFIMQDPPDFAAFSAACIDDAINPYVAQLADTLRTAGVPIIICTGRHEAQRQVTEVLLLQRHIFYDRMLMRADGDNRDDVAVKSEMLQQLRADGWAPRFAVEDRPDVVRMWRQQGVPCFQVDDATWFEPPPDHPGASGLVQWLRWMAQHHYAPEFTQLADLVNDQRQRINELELNLLALMR